MSMKLGVIVTLSETVNEELKKIRDMGFDMCQLVCWDSSMYNDKFSLLVNNATKENKIDITAFWCGWPGPIVWNFYDGPATLGLVPEAFRYSRIEALIKGSDFAAKIGVKNLATHVGFLPENPRDPQYSGVVNAVSFVAEHCRSNGQHFLFETGQETPVTLKRIIEDIGLDNLGINFDPANLLLYGKANPVDALDIIGKYVRGVHAKDGEYPTDGKHLGEEKPLGQGKVNFPALVAKLKQLGYNGSLTIEREISGEEQIKDITAAKLVLERLI